MIVSVSQLDVLASYSGLLSIVERMHCEKRFDEQGDITTQMLDGLSACSLKICMVFMA